MLVGTLSLFKVNRHKKHNLRMTIKLFRGVTVLFTLDVGFVNNGCCCPCSPLMISKKTSVSVQVNHC